MWKREIELVRKEVGGYGSGTIEKEDEVFLALFLIKT